ncbi:phage minor capsid protein [Microbacterium sp. GXS0129]|uniref:phage minor capsid protein n=1 Tax=Microbacterium sp. GXS0129 TaxID=3377836 RepID=UPI00383AD488
MALFALDPDSPSPEDIIEELSRELAARFRDVEDTLIQEVAERFVRQQRLLAMLPDTPVGGGLTAAQRAEQNRILALLAIERRRMVQELQGIAAGLVERLRTADLVQEVIRIAAEQGEAAAAAAMGFGSGPGVVPVRDGAGMIRTVAAVPGSAQAVAMVALSLQSRLEALEQRITRYPQDAYQRIVSIYTPGTLLGVTTSRVQQARAVQRFLAEGIPGFVDRAGRRWTIGAYAEMAGRTSVNRAFTDAGIWRMQQAGINLVTVVRGLDSCRKCADWAGAILSTDGTTGWVNLPHATINGESVPVFVRATVDQARAAGWGHPNCRCRLVAYSPGLTIPQEDTTYDEAAEKERAKQRELERDIRAAKRREASAMNDTDRARARADVRDAQATMRDFIRDTGRHRQSYREQLHFADGRGTAARPGPQPPTPAAPPAIRTDGVTTTRVPTIPASERTPQYIPPGLRIEPHEITAGERLAAGGYSVVWRELTHGHRVKNPDVFLNGDPAPWDIKSPRGSGGSTVSNQFRAAKEQGVRHFVFDMARTPLDEETVRAEVRRRFAASGWLDAVLFIGRDGSVTLYTRE